MRKISSVMLLLLFCMAVSAGGYDTAKRDSILSVITGAHMPKKKVSILKYGAKATERKIVCLHSKRLWRSRRRMADCK